MIWSNKDCPICGQQLKTNYSDIYDSTLYILRCPTPVFISEEEAFNLYQVSKSDYLKDRMKSHFEVEYQNGYPYFEVVTIFPFVIKSYNDVSNITKFGKKLNLHFIAETPYLELPLKDTAKALKKLQTYVLFS